MRILRLGDIGDDVGLLQSRLARAGYMTAEATHHFDDATADAVKALQTKAGLVVDGIAGPKTQTALLAGQRSPKHLTDADIVAAADKLGVNVSTVRTVNEVESAGAGFLADGRPKILFERHVFWRRLQAYGIDPAPYAALNPNIVSQTRGGYSGGAAEYVRLACAELIHADAAWESASWGAFQVMGENWKRLGYADAAEFVSRMEADEGGQLDAFVRFVAADPKLLAALKARKWAAFAAGYNGPAYHDNLYDVKLDRAYARYAAAGQEAA